MESSLHVWTGRNTSWKAETLEKSRGWITPGRWLRQGSKSDTSAQWGRRGMENEQSNFLSRSRTQSQAVTAQSYGLTTGGIREQRGALGMALPVWVCTPLKHLCCCNPRGSAASQKYPLLQDSWLLLGAGCSWQSWHGCGLSRVVGQVSTVFLIETLLQLWVTNYVTVRILTSNF